MLAYTIAPGFVLTEMSEDYVRRYGDAHILAELPLGEMAKAEDVAHVAAFLATGKARWTRALYDIIRIDPSAG